MRCCSRDEEKTLLEKPERRVRASTRRGRRRKDRGPKPSQEIGRFRASIEARSLIPHRLTRLTPLARHVQTALIADTRRVDVKYLLSTRLLRNCKGQRRPGGIYTYHAAYVIRRGLTARSSCIATRMRKEEGSKEVYSPGVFRDVAKLRNYILAPIPAVRFRPEISVRAHGYCSSSRDNGPSKTMRVMVYLPV